MTAVTVQSWMHHVSRCLTCHPQAAAGQAAAQAAAARRQQQQRQAGPRPFAGWSPFGAASKSDSGYAAQQPGPVIDAEWETIDEGDH